MSSIYLDRRAYVCFGDALQLLRYLNIFLIDWIKSRKLPMGIIIKRGALSGSSIERGICSPLWKAPKVTSPPYQAITNQSRALRTEVKILSID